MKNSARKMRYMKVLIPFYFMYSGRVTLPWFPFDHVVHWKDETLLNALTRAGFDQCQIHYINNFKAYTPLDRPLTMAFFRLYSGIVEWLYSSIGNYLDLRPTLLATAVKKS